MLSRRWTNGYQLQCLYSRWKKKCLAAFIFVPLTLPHIYFCSSVTRYYATRVALALNGVSQATERLTHNAIHWRKAISCGGAKILFPRNKWMNLLVSSSWRYKSIISTTEVVMMAHYQFHRAFIITINHVWASPPTRGANAVCPPPSSILTSYICYRLFFSSAPSHLSFYSLAGLERRFSSRQIWGASSFKLHPFSFLSSLITTFPSKRKHHISDLFFVFTFFV